MPVGGSGVGAEPEPEPEPTGAEVDCGEGGGGGVFGIFLGGSAGLAGERDDGDGVFAMGAVCFAGPGTKVSLAFFSSAKHLCSTIDF